MKQPSTKKIAQLADLLSTFSTDFHGSTDKVKKAVIDELKTRTDAADDLDLQNLLTNFTNSLKADKNFPFPHSSKIVKFNPTGYKLFNLPFYSSKVEFFFLPKTVAVLLGVQYDAIACAALLDAGKRFDPLFLRDKKKGGYTIARTEKQVYAKRSKVLERSFMRSIISGKEISPEKVWYCGSIVGVAHLTVGSRNLVFKTLNIAGTGFYY